MSNRNNVFNNTINAMSVGTRIVLLGLCIVVAVAFTIVPIALATNKFQKSSGEIQDEGCTVIGSPELKKAETQDTKEGFGAGIAMAGTGKFFLANRSGYFSVGTSTEGAPYTLGAYVLNSNSGIYEYKADLPLTSGSKLTSFFPACGVSVDGSLVLTASLITSAANLTSGNIVIQAFKVNREATDFNIKPEIPSLSIANPVTSGLGVSVYNVQPDPTDSRIFYVSLGSQVALPSATTFRGKILQVKVDSASIKVLAEIVPTTSGPFATFGSVFTVGKSTMAATYFKDDGSNFTSTVAVFKRTGALGWSQVQATIPPTAATEAVLLGLSIVFSDDEKIMYTSEIKTASKILVYSRATTDAAFVVHTSYDFTTVAGHSMCRYKNNLFVSNISQDRKVRSVIEYAINSSGTALTQVTSFSRTVDANDAGPSKMYAVHPSKRSAVSLVYANPIKTGTTYELLQYALPCLK